MTLRQEGYRTLVASRQGERQSRPRGGRDGGDGFQGGCLQLPRRSPTTRQEVRLYCCSQQRAQKERGIVERFKPALRAGAQPTLRGAVPAADSQRHREGPGEDRAAEGAESRWVLIHYTIEVLTDDSGRKCDGPDLEAPAPPGLDGHPSRRLLQLRSIQTDWDEELHNLPVPLAYTTLTAWKPWCFLIP